MWIKGTEEKVRIGVRKCPEHFYSPQPDETL